MKQINSNKKWNVLREKTNHVLMERILWTSDKCKKYELNKTWWRRRH